MLAMGTTSPLVVVTSESMVPTLEVGDLLVIQSWSEESISLGDIIVFWADWNPDTPVVHRIVEIIEESSGRLFVTRGDNNPTNDWGERTIEDILGVVVWRIPYLGSVSLFLRTTTGFTLMAFFFAVLLIVPEIIEKFRKETIEIEVDERSTSVLK